MEISSVSIFKESPLHNLKVQQLSLRIVEKYLVDILELNVTAVDVNSRPILKTLKKSNMDAVGTQFPGERLNRTRRIKSCVLFISSGFDLRFSGFPCMTHIFTLNICLWALAKVQV